MYCETCGLLNVPKARFCKGCGAALVPTDGDDRPSNAKPTAARAPDADGIVCGACGATNVRQALFCSVCGGDLKTASRANGMRATGDAGEPGASRHGGEASRSPDGRVPMPHAGAQSPAGGAGDAAVACPACGERNVAVARFCRGCGATIVEPWQAYERDMRRRDRGGAHGDGPHAVDPYGAHRDAHGGGDADDVGGRVGDPHRGANGGASFDGADTRGSDPNRDAYGGASFDAADARGSDPNRDAYGNAPYDDADARGSDPYRGAYGDASFNDADARANDPYRGANGGSSFNDSDARANDPYRDTNGGTSFVDSDAQANDPHRSAYGGASFDDSDARAYDPYRDANGGTSFNDSDAQANDPYRDAYDGTSFDDADARASERYDDPAYAYLPYGGTLDDAPDAPLSADAEPVYDIDAADPRHTQRRRSPPGAPPPYGPDGLALAPEPKPRGRHALRNVLLIALLLLIAAAIGGYLYLSNAARPEAVAQRFFERIIGSGDALSLCDLPEGGIYSRTRLVEHLWQRCDIAEGASIVAVHPAQIDAFDSSRASVSIDYDRDGSGDVRSETIALTKAEPRWLVIDTWRIDGSAYVADAWYVAVAQGAQLMLDETIVASSRLVDASLAADALPGLPDDVDVYALAPILRGTYQLYAKLWTDVVGPVTCEAGEALSLLPDGADAGGDADGEGGMPGDGDETGGPDDPDGPDAPGDADGPDAPDDADDPDAPIDGEPALDTPTPEPATSPADTLTPTDTPAPHPAPPGIAQRLSDVPADGYIIPDSDRAYVTREQLETLSKEMLGYARNEILARHGRPFKTQKYDDYFRSRTWYAVNPNYPEDDFDLCNEIEKANIHLIQEYERR